MAIQLVQAPEADNLYLTRSPVVVTLQENNAAIAENKTYMMAVRVKVWRGAASGEPDSTKEIIQVAHPDSKLFGVFNISALIRGRFLPADAGNTPVQITDGAGVFFVTFRYGYYLNGVYTNSGTFSGKFVVANGYALGNQEINKYAFNDNPMNDGQMFLSGTRFMQIVRNEPGGTRLRNHVCVYRGKKDIYLEYEDDKGYVFQETGNASSNSGTVIYRAMAEPETIREIRPLFNPDKRFWIRLKNSDGVVRDVMEVEIIERAFCDVEMDCIAFINRFGVWEYFHFRGRRSEEVKQSSDRFMRRSANIVGAVGLSNSGRVSQVGRIDVFGSKKIRVRTGYIDSRLNAQIQDLMLSTEHYSTITRSPVILDTDSVAFMENSNEDLVSYEIGFETAGNLIQNVQ